MVSGGRFLASRVHPDQGKLKTAKSLPFSGLFGKSFSGGLERQNLQFLPYQQVIVSDYDKHKQPNSSFLRAKLSIRRPEGLSKPPYTSTSVAN